MTKFRRFTVYMTEEDYEKFEEMAEGCGWHWKSDLFREIIRSAHVQFKAFRKAHPEIPFAALPHVNSVELGKSVIWLSPWYKPERIAQLDAEWAERNKKAWDKIKSGDV